MSPWSIRPNTIRMYRKSMRTDEGCGMIFGIIARFYKKARVGTPGEEAGALWASTTAQKPAACILQPVGLRWQTDWEQSFLFFLPTWPVANLGHEDWPRAGHEDRADGFRIRRCPSRNAYPYADMGIEDTSHVRTRICSANVPTRTQSGVIHLTFPSPLRAPCPPPSGSRYRWSARLMPSAM